MPKSENFEPTPDTLKQYPDGLSDRQREAYDQARDAANEHMVIEFERDKVSRQISDLRAAGKSNKDPEVTELDDRRSELHKKEGDYRLNTEIPALHNIYDTAVPVSTDTDLRQFGNTQFRRGSGSEQLNMITRQALEYSPDKKGLVMRDLFFKTHALRVDKGRLLDTYLHAKFSGFEGVILQNKIAKEREKGESVLLEEASKAAKTKITEISESLLPAARKEQNEAAIKAYEELFTKLQREEAVLSGQAEAALKTDYEGVLTEEEIELASTKL